MTPEEVVYQYYLAATTKSRNEAIELLKKRDFTTLHRNYIHWFNIKVKVLDLKSTLISEVIKELSEIEFQDNESEPRISTRISTKEWGLGTEDDPRIVITLDSYTIVPFEMCENLAKHYAKDSLFKLKHQPNGKDAEACRKILNIKL